MRYMKALHNKVVKITTQAVRQELKAELGHINAEVRSNGGTSIKDAVNRLDSDMALVKYRLDQADAHLDKQDEIIENIYKLLLRK